MILLRALVLTSALAACGRINFDERTADAGAPEIDLEVPIEMLSSVSLASDVAAIDFERSQTRLRTTDYDGVVSYAWEIVAENNEATPHDIRLNDRTAGITLATITVPASSFGGTRFRVPFTPISADGIYSIALDGAGAFNFNVFVARLIVHQVGATRTRIYIPLVCADLNVTGNQNSPVNGATDRTMLDTYSQADPRRYVLWRKDPSRFSTLAGRPWTFEALVYSNAMDRITYASLFDATTGQQVVASEVQSIGAAAVDLVETTFADNAADFIANDEFEARIRGETAAFDQYLFKAGLWVSLDPLVRGEVAYRIGGQQTGAGDLDVARALPALDTFTQQQVTFEAVAADGIVALVNDGTADAGTGNGPGAVASSQLTFAGKARQRTGALTLSPGHRYFARVGGASVTATSSSLVVDFGR